MATRRDFLTRVVQAGGYKAGFTVMNVLGLAGTGADAETKLELAPGSGAGVKILILGAGIAGLVSAYELTKAGYQCILLEARDRPGGRSWTIRNGSKVELTDGTTQVCEWEPTSYLNPGPARIPSVHKNLLGYCRELGVAVEPEVNSSRSTLIQSDSAFGGKPIELRQAVNDTRRYVADLLSKAVHQKALDDELNKDDREMLMAHLGEYGGTSLDSFQNVPDRSGYSRLPGAGDVAGIIRGPLEFHALLQARFWDAIDFEENFDMQATMLQPVGGMDRIPFAFAKKLGDVIRYGQEVREIRKLPKGVRVITRNRKGSEEIHEADYCICTITLPVLKNIDSDISAAHKQAIAQADYGRAYKIGWESDRFWERDFNIYGGISTLESGPVNLVWYPSGAINSATGVVISGYDWKDNPAFDSLSMQGKFEASRHGVEKLHPGYSSRLKKPIYVEWEKVPYTQGVLLSRYKGPDPDTAYRTMCQPDERIYFAGEFASHSIWQEGAAMAARRTVSLIAERARFESHPSGI